MYRAEVAKRKRRSVPIWVGFRWKIAPGHPSDSSPPDRCERPTAPAGTYCTRPNRSPAQRRNNPRYGKRSSMLHPSAGCLVTSCPGLCCPILLIPSAVSGSSWCHSAWSRSLVVPRAVKSRFSMLIRQLLIPLLHSPALHGIKMFYVCSGNMMPWGRATQEQGCRVP
ncbi:hypothetical protein BDW71DRAFT_79872 [Aspergillus fruticulosus]